MSTLHFLRFERLDDTNSPALEKTRSLGTEVAGVPTLRILIRVPVRLFVRLDFIQTGTLICYLSYFCHFCHEKSYPFASVRRKKNLDLQFDRSRLFLLSALNNVCVPLFW